MSSSLNPATKALPRSRLASEVHLKADGEIGAAGAEVARASSASTLDPSSRVSANAAEHVGPAVASHDAGGKRRIDLDVEVPIAQPDLEAERIPSRVRNQAR